MTVDDLLASTPSIVFDAVFIPGGEASIAALKGSGDAVLFVREAFKHAKAISALGEGAGLLATAGVLGPGGAQPAGVSMSGVGSGGAPAATLIADIAAHRHWSRGGNDSVAA